MDNTEIKEKTLEPKSKASQKGMSMKNVSKFSARQIAAYQLPKRQRNKENHLETLGKDCSLSKAEPPTQKDPHRSTKLNPRPNFKNTMQIPSWSKYQNV